MSSHFTHRKHELIYSFHSFGRRVHTHTSPASLLLRTYLPSTWKDTHLVVSKLLPRTKVARFDAGMNLVLLFSCEAEAEDAEIVWTVAESFSSFSVVLEML